MRETQQLFSIPVIAGLAVLLIGGIVAALRVRTWLDRRTRRRKARIAQRGERSARGWLEAHGFDVLEEQYVGRARMFVDGLIVEFDVCADYLVEREGRRAIVEVKTGDGAHPTNRATRRQIFEYAALFDADVYVFDAVRQHLYAVAFESIGRGRHLPSAWRYWWAGVAVGVGVSMLATWVLLLH